MGFLKLFVVFFLWVFKGFLGLSSCFGRISEVSDVL